MKEKIFNEMKKHGWDLGDDKNFDNVYNTQREFINEIFYYFIERDNVDFDKIDLKGIDVEKLFSMTTFISDFMTAINDIDNENSKGDK